MASLSTCPRFVIVFDDGDRIGSETVYQSELPDTIRRLCETSHRINDVHPFASEADEEREYQHYLATMPPEHERVF